MIARDVKSWANQTGWVSIAQIPLIIALAGKNNLVSREYVQCESQHYSPHWGVV